ncbi:uncharacterized protein LOC124263301 [Haliotis rubra]|uniref:uncharacterized protein LOC124263301 n=1 Tax=Haliotis rubra TaxID=36100 RepID=UPI001EE593EC|nr:uncharacterized protein LOC124263301 [Haliotis rubra]
MVLARIALTVLSLFVAGVEAKQCKVKHETITCFFGCCKASFSNGCCLPNQFGFFLVMVVIVSITFIVAACIHCCRRRPTYMAIPGAYQQTMWYSRPHVSYDYPPGIPSMATSLGYQQHNASNFYQSRFYQHNCNRGFQPTLMFNHDKVSPPLPGTAANKSSRQTQLPVLKEPASQSTSNPYTVQPPSQVLIQETRGRTAEPLSGRTKIPVLDHSTRGRSSRPITGRAQNPVSQGQTSRGVFKPMTGQKQDPAPNQPTNSRNSQPESEPIPTLRPIRDDISQAITVQNHQSGKAS